MGVRTHGDPFDTDHAASNVATSTVQSVLLVDDDRLLRSVTAMTLRRRTGWKVLEASTGEEAIRIADALVPDVILLDVRMPEMDGIEVVERLREQSSTAAIPVILMTGQNDEASLEEFRAIGVAALFAKPFSLEELPERVVAAMRGVRREDSPPPSPVELANAELRSYFASRLPTRVRELAQALAPLRAGTQDVGAWNHGRRLVHALRGTAGSYGFDAVSAAATTIESLLAGPVDTTTPDHDRLWERIDRELRRARAQGD